MTSAAGVDSLIAAWLGHLSVEKGVSANTLSNYRRDLKRYRDWLVSAGKTDLADVTTADVEAYVADLRRGDPSVGQRQSKPSRIASVILGDGGIRLHHSPFVGCYVVLSITSRAKSRYCCAP